MFWARYSVIIFSFNSKLLVLLFSFVYLDSVVVVAGTPCSECSFGFSICSLCLIEGKQKYNR